MSLPSSSLSPGDRAVVRASPAVAGVEAGTVVWVKRIVGNQVEADSQEAVPRTLTIPVAALAPFPDADGSSSARSSARQRPSLLVQVLRPIAVLVVIYLVWQSRDRWPRFEEPKPQPSKVQQPRLNPDVVPGKPLPARER
jgi:hypothetical protein